MLSIVFQLISIAILDALDIFLPLNAEIDQNAKFAVNGGTTRQVGIMQSLGFRCTWFYIFYIFALSQF